MPINAMKLKEICKNINNPHRGLFAHFEKLYNKKCNDSNTYKLLMAEKNNVNKQLLMFQTQVKQKILKLEQPRNQLINQIKQLENEIKDKENNVNQLTSQIAMQNSSNDLMVNLNKFSQEKTNLSIELAKLNNKLKDINNNYEPLQQELESYNQAMRIMNKGVTNLIQQSLNNLKSSNASDKANNSHQKPTKSKKKVNKYDNDDDDYDSDAKEKELDNYEIERKKFEREKRKFAEEKLKREKEEFEKMKRDAERAKFEEEKRKFEKMKRKAKNKKKYDSDDSDDSDDDYNYSKKNKRKKKKDDDKLDKVLKQLDEQNKQMHEMSKIINKLHGTVDDLKSQITQKDNTIHSLQKKLADNQIHNIMNEDIMLNDDDNVTYPHHPQKNGYYNHPQNAYNGGLPPIPRRASLISNKEIDDVQKHMHQLIPNIPHQVQQRIDPSPTLNQLNENKSVDVFEYPYGHHEVNQVPTKYGLSINPNAPKLDMLNNSSNQNSDGSFTPGKRDSRIKKIAADMAQSPPFNNNKPSFNDVSSGGTAYSDDRYSNLVRTLKWKISTNNLNSNEKSQINRLLQKQTDNKSLSNIEQEYLDAYLEARDNVLMDQNSNYAKHSNNNSDNSLYSQHLRIDKKASNPNLKLNNHNSDQSNDGTHFVGGYNNYNNASKNKYANDSLFNLDQSSDDELGLMGVVDPKYNNEGFDGTGS
ncbi:MAG: hypothetical protein HRU35_01815 [Rickettsiaceae bacterium]|nr:hypothetical protein [Rickettsiaceae bacterium]